MVEIVPTSRWAEAVFHVLAHVPVAAPVPASVYHEGYVRFVAERLGAAAERPLGADAALLARLLSTHEALAAVQVLPWLFASAAQARACADRELAALEATDVTRAGLRASLVAAGPAAEVLRGAALLELEVLSELSRPHYDRRALRRVLDRAQRVAPALAGCRVMVVRPLGLRGRAFDGEVLIGAPDGTQGPSLEHLRWQASHEATVLEAASRARAAGIDLGERVIEQVALALLAGRADACGLAAEHARWLRRLGPRPPSVDPARLPPAARGWIAHAVRSIT